VIILNDLLPGAVALYATYWALSIRRSLVGRVYRNHALWLSAICLILGVGSPIENASSNNAIVSFAIVLYTIVSIIVIFAFVDSTVPIARRSDPLLRSIFRWEKVRIVIWSDVGLLTIFFVYSDVSLSFDSSPWAVLGFPLVLFPLVLAVLALLVGARRSRDSLLRGSLAWFGAALFLALVRALISLVEMAVLNISTYDSTYSYPALAFGPAYILGTYALYRSARSLAPINRLHTIEPGTVTPAATMKT
jgi:hypothetical protein